MQDGRAQAGVVLVTGATGFLGGHLVRTLLARGTPVRALGRNLEVGLALQAAGADFRPVDLRDGPGMLAACAGACAVIHSGALSSAWGRYRDFHDINVTGTENVIAGCLAHEVSRLVYVSSPSVMSRHCEQQDLDESLPLPETFVSMYSETKALAEARVRAAQDAGLGAVILRPKAIYGPGDRALFPRIILALEKGRLPIIGDGVTMTDITHVRDVVQACLLAMERDAAAGNTYLVTGGEPVNLWGVITRIAERLGHPVPTRKIPVKKALRVGAVLEALWRVLPLPGEPPLTRYKASVLGYSQTYDISAARRDLGYEPQVRWEDGIEDFLAGLEGDREERIVGGASAPISPVPRSQAPGWDRGNPRSQAPGWDRSVPVGGALAPIPSVGGTVRITLLKAGHTVVRERLLGSGSWAKVRLPASFVLLEHPAEGRGLFDTGYSHRFFAATARLPFRIYRWLTPVEISAEEDAAAQLATRDIDPGSIRWILLTHFDPDHVGGLADFPRARIFCSSHAWADVRGLRGWAALHHRVLPEFFPDDIAARIRILPDPDGPAFGPLGPTLDLFGDRTVRVVSLPGHAAGHLGALVRSADGATCLFCGDACWTRGSVDGTVGRTGVHRLIAADRRAQDRTYETLAAFRREQPEIQIVPTHCRDAYADFGEK